jgi:prevent-host-death family protein
MRSFTSQDLQRKSSEVQEAALAEPIAITHHGRPRHVIMSMAEFERLQRANQPRVYRLEEIPDDILGDLAKARMHPRHRSLNKLLDD